MTRLNVLIAAWDDVAEPIFREAITGGGHRVTIINPLPREQVFLDEAKAGEYDVILLTNIGLPLDLIRGMIAPASKAGIARVIVMSGVADQESREAALREGAVAFYALPIPVDQICEALEAASGGAT